MGRQTEAIISYVEAVGPVKSDREVAGGRVGGVLRRRTPGGKLRECDRQEDCEDKEVYPACFPS